MFFSLKQKISRLFALQFHSQSHDGRDETIHNGTYNLSSLTSSHDLTQQKENNIIEHASHEYVFEIDQQWLPKAKSTTRCLWLDAAVELADAYNHRESCSGLRNADEPESQSWTVFMGVELCR